MDDFFRSLENLYRQFEDSVRDDWFRSRHDAMKLVKQTRRFARETAFAAQDKVVDLKVEASMGLREIQRQLVSDAFESQLDQLIKKTGKEDEFEAEAQAADEHWFAKVHASLYTDPLDAMKDDSTLTESLRERRNRVGRKLGFLLRNYRDDAIEGVKAGAVLGSAFGPKKALRFAMIAGGIKLAIVLGGVTYTVLMKDGGDISFM